MNAYSLSSAFRVAIILAVLGSGSALLRAQTLEGTPYINSWIGNTYGKPAEHIPHSIDNLYVTPSGKVAIITNWDEGGFNVALYSPTGAQLGIPEESGTGAWGRNSGEAVFVDENYIYQAMTQDGGYDADGVRYPVDPDTKWKCIRRFNLDGYSADFPGGNGYDGSMLVVATGTSEAAPSGVLVYNQELFVSDPDTGQIRVYDASTMAATPLRSFTVANPGLLDHDRLGFLWMLDKTQRKLICISRTDGTLQTASITFDPAIIPTGFCIDKVNDRILVANNGADQNVLIYTNIFTSPKLSSTFGTTGGINSGITGLVAPLKFSEPKGVGIDSAGNIFIGNNGVTQGGGRLEKYSAAGVLQWRLNGLIFTDNGDLNPADETEFYTKEFKFHLNLANTNPGSEWSVTAMTLNKVKYPEDARISTSPSHEFWTTAYSRHISGKKLLYVSDMYGGSLAIYRFNAATDGETAIPSGIFEFDTSEVIWRDANGDGLRGAGEDDAKSIDNDYSTHIFPDRQGGVWKANRDIPNGRIRYFPLLGFDVHGNPRYSYATSLTYTPAELYDVKRLEYDAANDVLYATGRSINAVADDWAAAGDRLVRYNNFTNNLTRSTAWSISLPYTTVSSPANDTNVKAFCEAGDYLFLIAYREGRIYVHRKSDGTKVGELLPTAATANYSAWADINGAVRATRRANGEYLIFAEENGNGKIMMYRWTPPTALAVFRTANALPADGSQDNAAPVGDGVPNLLKYAFNMLGSGVGQASALATPNAATLAPAGSAGLPFASLGSGPDAGKLQLTFVRRKASASPAPGVSYAVQFSNDLGVSDLWAVNASATESATSLDATFERVTVTDSLPHPPRRFVRARVTSSP
jgi:hypothetical protein